MGKGQFCSLLVNHALEIQSKLNSPLTQYGGALKLSPLVSSTGALSAGGSEKGLAWYGSPWP